MSSLRLKSKVDLESWTFHFYALNFSAFSIIFGIEQAVLWIIFFKHVYIVRGRYLYIRCAPRPFFTDEIKKKMRGPKSGAIREYPPDGYLGGQKSYVFTFFQTACRQASRQSIYQESNDYVSEWSPG